MLREQNQTHTFWASSLFFSLAEVGDTRRQGAPWQAPSLAKWGVPRAEDTLSQDVATALSDFLASGEWPLPVRVLKKGLN